MLGSADQHVAECQPDALAARADKMSASTQLHSARMPFSPGDKMHGLMQAQRLVRAAPLLAEPRLRRGDEVRLLGLTKDLRVMQRTSIVTTACSSLSIAPADIPRFRAVHEEVCH